MPIPPSILKKIQTIRKFMSSGGAGKSSDPGLHLLIHKLFLNPAWIVSDAESLDAVLALVMEFEAYRGKGSQYGMTEFYQRLSGLVYHARKELPGSEKRGEEIPTEVTPSPSPATAIPWVENLGRFFSSVCRARPSVRNMPPT